MKIFIVNGSVAEKSHTRALLKYIEELLNKVGIKTTFWDLKVRAMRVLIPEFHNDPLQTPDKNVKEFITLVTNSDGIILGTPLYHGSYAGVLKNALDNLYSDAFRNKPVAVVGNASTVRNPQALEHLRSVVRTLYGYAIQSQIATSNGDYVEKDDKFILTDENIIKRCHRMVAELVSLTKLLSENVVNQKD